jgi:hypothetical protein
MTWATPGVLPLYSSSITSGSKFIGRYVEFGGYAFAVLAERGTAVIPAFETANSIPAGSARGPVLRRWPSVASPQHALGDRILKRASHGLPAHRVLLGVSGLGRQALVRVGPPQHEVSGVTSDALVCALASTRAC